VADQAGPNSQAVSDSAQREALKALSERDLGGLGQDLGSAFFREFSDPPGSGA
jgi:hypothetical protein